MKINVQYKKEFISVEVPDSIDIDIVEPNDVSCLDEMQTLKRAIDNPVDSPKLDEFLAGCKNLLIIVNDATRPTPTAAVLEYIYEYFRDYNYKIIVATGVHRGADDEEVRTITGKLYDKVADNVISHDSRNDEMVFLGNSKNGTEMWLNKIGVESDKIIIIGSVEPHYFAGYTGGRKGFLPGIASYKTITQNHKLALDPRAKALALEGNPVHEDMIDAIKKIDNDVFTIMTVLEKNHKIYAATSGNINSAFYAAIDKADEVFVRTIRKKFDIVVTCAKYPMDIDLYQSQKALDNGKLALKENGIMILVSSCRDGVGEKAFLELLSSCDSPQAVLDKIEDEYVLGYHKAGKMAEINLWADVWAVSDLDDRIWESIFIKPVSNLQQAVNMAIEKKGPDSSVIFLLDGSVTVPKVNI